MPRIETNLIVNRCPHCNVDNPNLTLLTKATTSSHNGSNQRIWAFYSCRRCGGVVTVCGSATVTNPEVQEMFPTAVVIDASVPARAKAYLDQAIDSLHAPSGAIMLAASSIDAMLKDKGYKEGSLYSRIKKASEDHLITKEMSLWAHEVRLDANDERHADEDATMPTEKDAQRTVDFAMALAQFLFVLPSKVERGIEDAKAV